MPKNTSKLIVQGLFKAAVQSAFDDGMLEVSALKLNLVLDII
jgi:hypothetical protein